MQVQLIGDEIYYGGYLIAVLAQDKVPISVMREFEYDFKNESLFDGASCKECGGEREIKHLHDCKWYEPPEGCKLTGEQKDFTYDAAMDDVQRAAKEYARGGLLKLSDLATICKQLAEEE